MMTTKLSQLAAFLSIGLPTAHIRIDSIEITTAADNPYFDDWSVEINDPYTFSIKAPVKKDLPDNMMIKGRGAFSGNILPEKEISVCETFNELLYGKDLLAHGIPYGVFPSACPVKAGDNFEISKYTFPNSRLVPGVSDGSIVADIYVYEPGKEPYITGHLEGALIHDKPGFGR